MARKSKFGAPDAPGFNEFAAQRAKWDFSKESLKANGIASDATLMECWAYEFARENDRLVRAIRDWRAGLGEWLSFEQLRKASFGSDLIRVSADRYSEHWGSLVRVPFRAIYLFCPEWPEKSFLEIDPEERTRRIKSAGENSWYATDRNWSKGLDDYPASIEADPRYLGLRYSVNWMSFLGQLIESAASKNQLRAFFEDDLAAVQPEFLERAVRNEYLEPRPEDLIYAKAECVVFRVLWKYRDEVLLSLFKECLNKNRPASEDPRKFLQQLKRVRRHCRI